MKINSKYELRKLLKKYVEGRCSEEEWEALSHHIRQSHSPGELDDVLRSVWNETKTEERYEELILEKLLAQEAEILLPEAKKRRIVILRWAAVAAVLIGVVFMMRWWNDEEPLMVFETGFGENVEFVLDDGTKIYLNANSRLTWNNDWKKEGIRKANLEGEAYFDVAHQEQKDGYNSSSRMPFEVYTQDLTIRVLGTSFNAIQRRGKTEVLLDEGEVELALHRARKDGSESSESEDEIEAIPEDRAVQESQEASAEVVKMVPGQWVSFSSVADELLQKTIDSSEPMTEWKEGTLFYQDVEFRFILENLEDIYGKTFEVADSVLLQTRVNVGVPYEDWETVIDMMSWMVGIEVIEVDENQLRIEKRKEN